MPTTLISARGFTIVELMITLAVAAILAAIAAPSFTTLIQDNRLATQVNELQATLSLARSEAIKRNVNITICRSNNGTGCVGNWQNGWILFTDIDSDGIVDGGNVDEILRVHGPISGGNTLAFAPVAINRVTYGSDSLVRDGVGTFRFCDDRGASDARGILINLTGRPSLAQDTNADGIVEGDDGNNLTCP